MTSAPWLELSRTVRFSDTDAAGVMHFQQLLGWCHQAWEESLERFGLPAGSVFPGGRGEQPSVALPIVHCHADFRAPVQVGDQLLDWCHQAWEESLECFGLPAGSVFPGGRGEQPSVALPIVHCHADFRAPVQVGDKLLIRLEPERLDPSSFTVNSQVLLEEQLVAKGCLRHVAIDAQTRRRCALPDGVDRWLEASSLGRIQPL